MRRAFLIHGAYGNPHENWFPWLREELGKKGFEVIVPKFPTPEGQDLGIWRKMFDKHIEEVDSETIFIGHSLGPSFILDILERIDKRVMMCIFVSGFVGLLGNDKFDKINSTFVDREFDWEKIRKNCDRFVCFHSDDDPYVSLRKGIELSSKVGGDLRIIKGAGHFNSDSGYLKFEKLLEVS